MKIIGTVKYSLLRGRKTVLTIHSSQIKAGKIGFLLLLQKKSKTLEHFVKKKFSQPYFDISAGILLGVKNTHQTK